MSLIDDYWEGIKTYIQKMDWDPCHIDDQQKVIVGCYGIKNLKLRLDIMLCQDGDLLLICWEYPLKVPHKKEKRVRDLITHLHNFIMVGKFILSPVGNLTFEIGIPLQNVPFSLPQFDSFFSTGSHIAESHYLNFKNEVIGIPVEQ
jgi:hypothetical protein